MGCRSRHARIDCRADASRAHAATSYISPLVTPQLTLKSLSLSFYTANIEATQIFVGLIPVITFRTSAATQRQKESGLPSTQPPHTPNKVHRSLVSTHNRTLNNYEIKLAKLLGEFVWHSHAETDEIFFVLSGTLNIQLRDRKVIVKTGEIFVVPEGVEHCPKAEEEVGVLLLEPKGVVYTGDAEADKRIDTKSMQDL